MAREINRKLFPFPSHALLATREKTPIIPRTWPGVSSSSTDALLGILSDNHKKWHVFFNDKGFHNHISHAVLTLWCLGADASILESSYKGSSSYMKPAFSSPSSITEQNWKDHLGDENYYQAYTQFFADQAETKDFGQLLEEYVFAPGANFISGAQEQPEMTNRFFDSLIHPMIHTGLGLEFGLPGVVAEGLAQVAIHQASASGVFPPALWEQSAADLATRLAGAVGLTDKAPKPDVHAFTILARIINNPALKPRSNHPLNFYSDTIKDHGDTIVKYVNQWTLDDGDLKRKVEELLWMNSLIYAVGGSEADGSFNADFFHMHLVTSSLFLTTVFSYLKRSSQVILLRSYFAVSLGWYIGRGLAPLDIKRFFSNPNTLHPTAPGPHPTPHKDANPSAESPFVITPNPWLPIIQSTLTHPDDHLPKLQRALSEFSSEYGSVKRGYFAGTELEGAELVDGSLFIRAAGLTATRLGWVREGKAPLEGPWDRRGLPPPDSEFYSAASLMRGKV